MVLEVNNINVAYDRYPALNQISLSVNAGEILAVIGPNGAGKSTMLRAVCGIQPIQSGTISIAGTNISRLSTVERARRLAMVPQARDLPSSFTVYQTVLLGRTPYLGWLGRANSIDHQQTKLALERTQLIELADRLIYELSGGEQQRVLLARALAQTTSVLLLDEPTTFLDLHHQSSFLNLVRQLTIQDRLAVMMVMHDLNLASLCADKIALLADGRLIANGTPTEVLTEENLAVVYEVPVQVIPHPQYDSPLILPDGRNPA
jgi:iron complex transport system ATP-binding protein